MTNDTCFGTFYMGLLHHLSFFVQGMQHTTGLAWPLLYYHGNANANIFIEANSFLFLPNRLSLTRIFAASVRLSLRWSLTLTVCFIPTLYNQYVVFGYIFFKKEYNLGLQPTYIAQKKAINLAIVISWLRKHSIVESNRY